MSHHLVISNWHRCYSACLTICVGACVGCHSPSSGVPVYAAKVRVSPVASQCGADSTKFLQWHSSVGLFWLSFSSGVPVYTGSTSGIPVYTGPASVHWLRVRDIISIHTFCYYCKARSIFWHHIKLQLFNVLIPVGIWTIDSTVMYGIIPNIYFRNLVHFILLQIRFLKSWQAALPKRYCNIPPVVSAEESNITSGPMNGNNTSLHTIHIKTHSIFIIAWFDGLFNIPTDEQGHVFYVCVRWIHDTHNCLLLHITVIHRNMWGISGNACMSSWCFPISHIGWRTR